tara:strand:+ start:3429 stop:4019 length:591 start_codon:yes stop_codon:yes gene_type:complete
MANYEATRYDYSGANLTNVQGVNTGLIVPWGDSSIPSGFLECNGANVSRSTYSALFAVIGTTYGAGNGSTTFTLPDLQDDCCVSASPGKALASTGGANTVASNGTLGGTTASTAVSTPEMPSHNHNANPAQSGIRGGGSRAGSAIVECNMDPAPNGNIGPSFGGGSGHTHPITGNMAGNATSVLQPYLTLIYIIKT